MSRIRTDYMKGFAIISVLCNHYINGYTSFSLNAIANGIISVFFVLSGYGIYASLHESHHKNKLNILFFYLKRIIRIYPLYLISIISYYLLTKNVVTISNLLALPTEQAPGIYWFVTSIIQCYLLAPLIFYLLEKWGYISTFFIAVMLLVAGFFYYKVYSLPYTREFFVYRHVPFGHIFIFIGGMMIKGIPKTISLHKCWILSLIVFAVSIYITRFSSVTLVTQLFGLLLIFSSVSLCYSIINFSKEKLIFEKALSVIGAYSYSIYLFHMYYYKALFKMNIIYVDSILSFFIALVLFPVFFYVIMTFEKATTRVASKLIYNYLS